MLAAAALLALPLAAQIPPSPAEIAAYRGLHAAAQRGDPDGYRAAGRRPGRCLATRDAHGRTPSHVATYARQREAIKALDPGRRRSGRASTPDRYDAATIAAVADDEETLRVLLARGASAKLVTSRYDGTRADRRGAPRPRRRGAAADRRLARRSTTSTTCTGPR